MSALNDAVLTKEVFLAYLNAALLEPVLAIAGGLEGSPAELLINLLMLFGILAWTYLVTDAFDYDDIAQQKRYHGFAAEIAEDPKKYSWLQVPGKDDAVEERKGLVGTMSRDIALWFMLWCIIAAWLPGVVTHHMVIHAYIILVMWAMLHHRCRQATAWATDSGNAFGFGYVESFLLPSSALMPLEYCLPLQETFDNIDSLEALEEWRLFIQKRTGVELMIRV